MKNDSSGFFLKEMELELQTVTGENPRFRSLTVDQNKDRAEHHRRKQPKLLRVLRDAYARYISAPHNHHKSLEINTDDDEIVSQIVRNHDITSRKIELQRKLIDVLEGEREVLLTINHRMEMKLAEAIEANQRFGMGPAKNKMVEMDAAGLGGYVAENVRIGLLEEKIGVLQNKVCGLEEKNMNYFQERVRTEDFIRELCAEINKVKTENKRLEEVVMGAERRKRSNDGGMWRWKKGKGKEDF
ncbi:hypothetical protein ZOSMA_221G00320 [Zostera marina]|uniref:NAB domain-containing protein n=1 Tax=Zostera marina TaxID=29655 RepID=A0A0K9PJA7_ZOSMR|nr:hypothetical protein ZOSMA_221G00320 [Zostera marina]